MTARTITMEDTIANMDNLLFLIIYPFLVSSKSREGDLCIKWNYFVEGYYEIRISKGRGKNRSAH
ncbi:hypothetical protein GCM10011389_29760 [Pontibacillus salipaludis]|uniref:Uncharacterized protein n=1 Tax=Pontibacillus salipaludis TaxID=1697394 RepID=A0ABQ1QAC0_9BACI|nr:hypothetical protein GCM10011389_29760 [Pontibacillus salipaludis]